MKKIKMIKTKYNTVVLYEFPKNHSPQMAVKWVHILLSKSGNKREWINLENTSDGSDDGGNSISLPMGTGITSIINELNHRNIDSILTHFNINACRVSVAINLYSYIVSVGMDGDDVLTIKQVEEFLDAL